jgi:polyphosphate kinase
MHRNLDRRVESLVRITDAAAQAELRRVLDLIASDRSGGFDLHGDGSWHRRGVGDGDHSGPSSVDNPQEILLRRAGRPE